MCFLTLMRKLQLIAAGIGIGQDLAGVQNGPSAWIDFFRQHYPQLLSLEPDCSATTCEIRPVHLKNNKDSKFFPFDPYEMLARQVAQSQKNKILPIVLGGDHSIAIGSVMGSLQTHRNIKLLWIDAHGDINTPETTLTGRVHGMPLAYLLGLWAQDRHRPRLQEKNVVLFGVRDLDRAEKRIIRDLGIKIILQSDIRRSGIEACWSQAAQHLDLQNSAVHVSFDVDAIDPKVFPQTGVPVKGGLSANDVKVLFEKLNTLPNLQAIDLVEFNPLVSGIKAGSAGLHLLGGLLKNFIEPSQNHRRLFEKPNDIQCYENMTWPHLAN